MALCVLNTPSIHERTNCDENFMASRAFRVLCFLRGSPAPVVVKLTLVEVVYE